MSSCHVSPVPAAALRIPHSFHAVFQFGVATHPQPEAPDTPDTPDPIEQTHSHAKTSLHRAFEGVRAQKDLEDLVRVYDEMSAGLTEREAQVFKRAAQIELGRRETKGLIDWWRIELSKPLSPRDRYEALLLCAEQVRQSFVSWDWELDAEARGFLSAVEQELNDPRFLPFWDEVEIVEVEDGELANSLHRALHVANQVRGDPLKLRSPLPHDVLKTWVALQRLHGPADDFAPREEYGLRADPSQHALRTHLWQNFNQLEEMAERCAQYPQARHECERLSLAIDILRQYQKSSNKAQAKQTLLDQVRESPQLRPLLDDILLAIA